MLNVSRSAGCGPLLLHGILQHTWLQKLKPELKSRGLDTSGKKADLVERLEAYLKTNSTEPKEPAQPGPGSNAADAEDSKPAAAQVSVPMPSVLKFEVLPRPTLLHNLLLCRRDSQ